MDFGVTTRLPEQADPPMVEGMDEEQLELMKKLYLL